MSTPYIDSKLVIWIVGVVFVAGGMVYTLNSVASDVEKLTDVVVEHTTSEGHPTRGVRVDYIEERQQEMAETVKQLDTRQQTMMTNQSAICSKLGADCR